MAHDFGDEGINGIREYDEQNYVIAGTLIVVIPPVHPICLLILKMLSHPLILPIPIHPVNP
jgi:hypothetical protein